MSSLRDIYLLVPYWFSPINLRNVIAAVVMHGDTCIRLLPHIFAWNYQLIVYGNPTLVRYRSTISQSSPCQLGILPPYL